MSFGCFVPEMVGADLTEIAQALAGPNRKRNATVIFATGGKSSSKHN
jgi:hypothetical protein